MENDRLKRVLCVLNLLTTEGPQSVTHVSNQLELPMSSTHDLLKAMVLAGMLQSTISGYEIGPSTVKLTYEVQKRFHGTEIAAPELKLLVERVGFDVYLAVRTGNQVSYSSHFRGTRGVNIDIPLGLPLYRHATAAGKLFAALDHEIRREVLGSPRKQLTPRTRTDVQVLARDFQSIAQRGISISNEEAVSGVIGMATPIRLPDGKLFAVAHISAPASSLQARAGGTSRLDSVCVELLASCAVIEKLLIEGSTP